LHHFINTCDRISTCLSWSDTWAYTWSWSHVTLRILNCLEYYLVAVVVSPLSCSVVSLLSCFIRTVLTLLLSRVLSGLYNPRSDHWKTPLSVARCLLSRSLATVESVLLLLCVAIEMLLHSNGESKFLLLHLLLMFATCGRFPCKAHTYVLNFTRHQALWLINGSHEPYSGYSIILLCSSVGIAVHRNLEILGSISGWGKLFLFLIRAFYTGYGLFEPPIRSALVTPFQRQYGQGVKLKPPAVLLKAMPIALKHGKMLLISLQLTRKSDIFCLLIFISMIYITKFPIH
jgi:hypothetical protein